MQGALERLASLFARSGHQHLAQFISDFRGRAIDRSQLLEHVLESASVFERWEKKGPDFRNSDRLLQASFLGMSLSPPDFSKPGQQSHMGAFIAL